MTGNSSIDISLQMYGFPIERSELVKSQKAIIEFEYEASGQYYQS